MCGPFALWATYEGNRSVTIAAYHFGRLTTYLSAGLAAGVLGSALTIAGDMAGYQMLAAKLAGVLLIFIGLAKLIPVLRRRSTTGKPSRLAGLIHQAKPLLAERSPGSRAFLVGLLTTWLPCGWLYLFVMVAGGTGSVVSSLTVMLAFWIGTLPSLTALALGAQSLVPRFRKAVPIAAGVMLVVTGLYTATGRAAADLSRMSPPASVGPNLAEEPLPCCEGEGVQD